MLARPHLATSASESSSEDINERKDQVQVGGLFLFSLYPESRDQGLLF